MRPSNNKVDMEELVLLSSTRRGHAMSSNPNSNRECFPVRKTQFSSTLDFGDPSPIDVQTFESKKYRRTAKRKVNSSGEPFFLKGTRELASLVRGIKIHTSTSTAQVFLLSATVIYLCLLLKPPFFG